MTPAEAAAYLRSIGEDIEPVTTKHHLARGWTFHSRTAQQMLTDADVIEYAHSARELAS